MNIAFRSLCALSLLAATPLNAADSEDVKKDLARLAGEFAAALAKNDVPGVLSRLSEDWKVVLAEGHVMDRVELGKALESGKLKFSAYTVSDLDVRIFGEAAVIVGRGNSKGSWEGNDFTSADRFTDVFIRRDGKWLCVSSHSSEIAD